MHVGHFKRKKAPAIRRTVVLRTSRIGRAHFGQRSGLGADLSPESLSMDKIAQCKYRGDK
jgi:hypothetical protein